VAKVLKEKFGLQTTLKRPNDVLVKGKKICGVLVEAQGRANGRVESLVIGIGLNVNSSEEELVPGATSLKEESGKKEAKTPLFEALLRQLKSDLEGIKGL
jgi:BirA family biotin operon repressor/biotin-[acetyl-CoA-carboxylase] ligase